MICTHCEICIRYKDECKEEHICKKKTPRQFADEEGLKDIRPSEWKPGKVS
jgi:hypothetical protein